MCLPCLQQQMPEGTMVHARHNNGQIYIGVVDRINGLNGPMVRGTNKVGACWAAYVCEREMAWRVMRKATFPHRHHFARPLVLWNRTLGQ